MLSLLVKPEVQAFIKEHKDDDLTRLLLNKHKFPDIPMDLVVDQIRAREKAIHKIPLWANTEGIIMPPLLSMEQCSSEQTASYKASLLNGSTCIDLTGGAGIDTFYLSKQFNKVHYIEENKELAEVAQHNFKLLGANNIIVHSTTSEEFLSELNEEVDVIYIDPARRDQQNKVFRFESCTPNILPLQNELLTKANFVMVKASPMLDITMGVQQLNNVSEIHVVAIKNEVKELLFVQEQNKTEDIQIKTIDLANVEKFDFRQGDTNEISIGEIQDFLYEPNAAIMKSGGINLLSEFYQINKLHPNTHLFTSNTLIASFPGRIFRVENVVKYSKKEINRHIEGQKANIGVRNFPDSVDAFRKKTGLKPGGNLYVFGYTNINNSPEVAICKKAT